MSLVAGSHARLLVAEDDYETLSLVQTVLEEGGYVVTPVASLPAALTLLEEQVFHFILTDLFYWRGQAPLQSIRPLLAKAPPIPVGVMTAWDVPIEAVTQARLAFLIQKPFDIDDLLRVVRTSLHHSFTLDPRQVQVVEQFYAAVNARDWGQVSRLCTPDVTVVSLSAPAVAPFGSLGGLLTYQIVFERRLLTLPGFTFEELTVFPRPFGVAVRWGARWQSRAGLIHHIAGSTHFHFQGERIARIAGSF